MASMIKALLITFFFFTLTMTGLTKVPDDISFETIKTIIIDQEAKISNFLQIDPSMSFKNAEVFSPDGLVFYYSNQIFYGSDNLETNLIRISTRSLEDKLSLFGIPSEEKKILTPLILKEIFPGKKIVHKKEDDSKSIKYRIIFEYINKNYNPKMMANILKTTAYYGSFEKSFKKFTGFNTRIPAKGVNDDKSSIRIPKDNFIHVQGKDISIAINNLHDKSVITYISSVDKKNFKIEFPMLSIYECVIEENNDLRLNSFCGRKKVSIRYNINQKQIISVNFN